VGAGNAVHGRTIRGDGGEQSYRGLVAGIGITYRYQY